MKKQRIKTTRKEYFQRSNRDYKRQFGVVEVDPTVVAQWMVDTGRYQERPLSKTVRCRQELVRALKDEMTTDPQGREVRANACVVIRKAGETQTFWANMYDLKPKRMRLSLAGTMRQIEGAVMRHRTINESYNDNNRHGGAVPLFDYDFNKMIAERAQPTEYPDAPPMGAVAD